MDIQRTILWVIFGMSLLFLWDRWQVHQGRPSMMQPAPATQGASGSAGGVANAPGSGQVSGTAKGPDASVPSGGPGSQGSGLNSGGAAASSSQGVPSAPGASAAGSVEAAAGVSAPDARVKVQTDVLRVDLDPQGAMVVRAELWKQKVAPDWTAGGLAGFFTGRTQDRDQHMVLLDVSGEREYLAQTGLFGAPGAQSFPNHRTAWQPVGGGAGQLRELADGQERLDVAFEAEGGGLKVVKTYTFHRGRFDVQVSHQVTNVGTEPLSPRLYLQIVRDNRSPPGSVGAYATFTGPAVFTDAKKYQKVDFSDIAKGKSGLDPAASDNGWIAMIQHYFVTAWVPPKGAPRQLEAVEVDKARGVYAIRAKLDVGTLAPGASQTVESALWIGPQDQDALSALAPELDRVVDYGWLTIIAKPLFVLLQWLHKLVLNWGWAIVLLTVVVKAALFPLSAAGYRSMARMKDLAPRMAKLKEQHGDDKARFQQAMMELYQREKINPLTMGGCFPILLQMPVFIALYWVLLASVELRNQPWMLWVKDLATPDPYFVLPLVMMATMWVQYKLNPKPPDPMQAKMMAIMPFIFGIMFFLFPAGLVLYWIVNNVLSIAQQWYVNRSIDQAKLAKAAR